LKIHVCIFKTIIWEATCDSCFGRHAVPMQRPEIRFLHLLMLGKLSVQRVLYFVSNQVMKLIFYPIISSFIIATALVL
jgi:uncharacterized membrane protein